jgi:hypothetical protein
MASNIWVSIGLPLTDTEFPPGMLLVAVVVTSGVPGALAKGTIEV